MILNNFPRTVSEMKLLEKLKLNVFAVNFTLSEDILVKKVKGTRKCSKCHKIKDL